MLLQWRLCQVCVPAVLQIYTSDSASWDNEIQFSLKPEVQSNIEMLQ